MRIGCLMVTENRAPIAGIGVASFAVQHPLRGADAVLLVLDNSPDPLGYGQVIKRLEPHLQPWQRILYYATDSNSYGTGPASVPSRIDLGCERLFEHHACDAVAIWDDDDHSALLRLALTVNALRGDDPPPAVLGYDRGWFVNLRTLRGEHIDVQPMLWGGSLAFTRAAWRKRMFVGLSSPGYDREFVAHFTGRRAVLADDPTDPTFAFSHGKNVATWLTSPGVDLQAKVMALPYQVAYEVARAQKFLIDRRVFPPQPQETV